MAWDKHDIQPCFMSMGTSFNVAPGLWSPSEKHQSHWAEEVEIKTEG